MKEKDYYKYCINQMINEIGNADILRSIYIFVLDILKEEQD